jgi:hypothetical protein
MLPVAEGWKGTCRVERESKSERGGSGLERGRGEGGRDCSVGCEQVDVFCIVSLLRLSLVWNLMDLWVAGRR